MRFRWSVIIVAVFAAVAAWVTNGQAGVDDKQDREAIRVLQRQLRSPIPSMRVLAVEGLREFAVPEVAKLIVPFALTDSEMEVRRAAYKTLLAWKDHREIEVFLLKTLGPEIRSRKQDVSVAAALIAVLLASDTVETQRDLGKLLDGNATAGAHGVVVITTVADELGKLGDQQSLTVLRRMTQLTCFARTFACRRAVVQAIIAIRLPEAVEELIALLPEVDGEVRGDILRYLGRLSGEHFGDNSEAWQAWWEKNKDHGEFPETAATDSAAAATPANMSSYYGLTIEAGRMVFVLDISGSMRGPRLTAAQRELISAIERLPENVTFNIVAFNSQIAVWRNVLMRATPAAKKAAGQFIHGLRAQQRTAAYDALEAAFRFDAEAIYFLSDGEPNCGKIANPAAILTAITQANRTRRITVNTIGAMAGETGSPLDEFMKTLAEQNYGEYRRVDR